MNSLRSKKSKIMSKKIVMLLCKLGVAGGILYYILQKTDIIEILTVIKSAKLFYVLFAFILYLFCRYITAYQSKIVFVNQGIKLSTFRIFIINIESNFYDLFIPGGVGSSAVKWYKFSKPEGKRVQAFTSIVVIRLVNAFIMIVIGVFALLLKNPFNSLSLNVVVISLIVSMVFLQLAIFNKKASIFIDKFLNIFFLRVIPELVSEKVIKFWESFNKLKRLSVHDLLILIIVSISLYLLNTYIFFVISISISINLSVLVIAWITATVLLINMIPISISGLGVREGSLLFLLDKYHISDTETLSFSFIIFGIGIITALIGGAIEAKNYFKGKLT